MLSRTKIICLALTMLTAGCQHALSRTGVSSKDKITGVTLNLNRGAEHQAPPTWSTKVPIAPGYIFFWGEGQANDTDSAMDRATQSALFRFGQVQFPELTTITSNSIENLKETSYSRSSNSDLQLIDWTGVQESSEHDSPYAVKEDGTVKVYRLFRWAQSSVVRSQQKVQALVAARDMGIIEHYRYKDGDCIYKIPYQNNPVIVVSTEKGSYVVNELYRRKDKAIGRKWPTRLPKELIDPNGSTAIKVPCPNISSPEPYDSEGQAIKSQFEQFTYERVRETLGNNSQSLWMGICKKADAFAAWTECACDMLWQSKRHSYREFIKMVHDNPTSQALHPESWRSGVEECRKDITSYLNPDKKKESARKEELLIRSDDTRIRLLLEFYTAKWQDFGWSYQNVQGLLDVIGARNIAATFADHQTGFCMADLIVSAEVADADYALFYRSDDKGYMDKLFDSMGPLKYQIGESCDLVVPKVASGKLKYDPQEKFKGNNKNDPFAVLSKPAKPVSNIDHLPPPPNWKDTAIKITPPPPGTKPFDPDAYLRSKGIDPETPTH